ncbi:hypothetical protein A2130_02945 [Candidatus Woesebacteria bacterium GWC2_33_12]|uniref:Peptidase n=1 Tax=Candidatus Woesebacteria bacterium GW2011_GWB1_33_22 TaxID=1618566 RepID=A0A0G0C238_9BACT|nr:MAG: Peptidase [Candidatus Woesebacteria bacterium GW2011_GWC2_33_12]KKP42447.1 MAG: Peptidase [Candidatus Woesebacteria bacterium GW2011_GWA2_33_20]KKP45190.1 MAG: Peptidase [Candidatus Woesebacteria bacterium GW2011_GWB1_33_22]KKP46189.1 MAG: Peptidase [Microgenomates group bacterium GW2011_GWC1_33_28]KKP50859.1 MAG: Peptidase [Candidatus Woesebacteria bacterium GW2011_GWA1_33_33]OGM07616.1 MAG: hypothetical protein A2130_02945 [Candidatus Woesebacteria bacterium GWC2_33_12]OGM85928.1 MA
MKLKLYITLGSLILISLGWWGSDIYKNYLNKEQMLPAWNKPKPLEKYTIENLSKTNFEPSKITVDKNLFNFNVAGKKVTGLINIPESGGPFPVIVLLRGYVDQSIYTTGTGTKRVGEFLSQNGYITIAPDFLGYGGSDIESSNIFEARFQTYTTTLTLLKSINKENFPDWDQKNIFIWAHSNGGQIALTILEITGEKYPTVLWAPVTENFPYSVLFYTNESDDHGKYIRRELSKFESNYDVEKYSLTNYLDRVNAPIEYHYGTNDDAIPSEWRDKFVNQMKSLEKDFTNYNHSGADHNLNPLWSDVIKKTLDFFTAKLQV